METCCCNNALSRNLPSAMAVQDHLAAPTVQEVAYHHTSERYQGRPVHITRVMRSTVYWSDHCLLRNVVVLDLCPLQHHQAVRCCKLDVAKLRSTRNSGRKVAAAGRATSCQQCPGKVSQRQGHYVQGSLGSAQAHHLQA